MKITNTPTLLQATYHILALIIQKGVDKKRLTALIESGFLADVLEADLSRVNPYDWRKVLNLDPPQQLKTYGLSLEEMIDAGWYDWFNGDITAERFLIVGEGKVEYETKLFYFGRDISSDTANNLIQKDDPENPWLSATTEILLAFGAVYPEMQRQFPIVGLGASCKVNSYCSVLVLVGDDSERGLDCCWCDSWDSHYRFLAARKKLSSSS